MVVVCKLEARCGKDDDDVIDEDSLDDGEVDDRTW